MHSCDTATTDPVRHEGPFKHLYRFESSVLPLIAETCHACGTVVIRRAKPRPEPHGQDLQPPWVAFPA